MLASLLNISFPAVQKPTEHSQPEDIYCQHFYEFCKCWKREMDICCLSFMFFEPSKKLHFILVYEKRKHFYFLFRNEIDWEWVVISYDRLIGGDRDSNMAFDMFCFKFISFDFFSLLLLWFFLLL